MVDTIEQDLQAQIDAAKGNTASALGTFDADKQKLEGALQDKSKAIIGGAEHDLETAATEPERKVPETPKHELSKATIATGFTLMLVAIAGSAKMKLGSEGAMAGLTGAINGMMEGDQLAYKRHMDTYNMQVKAINDEHAARLKHFNITRATDKLTYTKQIEELSMRARADGTQVGYSMRFYEDALKAEAKLVEKLNKHHEDLAKTHAQHEQRARDSRTGHQKEYDAIMRTRAATNKTTVEEEKKKDPYSEKWATLSAGKKSGGLPPRAKTPADWVAEVKKEHPDWAAEKVAEEAKKRAGIK